MPHIAYEIVEHDGGWAYKVGDVFSETFPSRAMAHQAAAGAAARQRREGDPAAIEYEDASGQWHSEVVKAGDRPETSVEDSAEPAPSLSRDVGAEEPLPDGPSR